MNILTPDDLFGSALPYKNNNRVQGVIASINACLKAKKRQHGGKPSWKFTSVLHVPLVHDHLTKNEKLEITKRFVQAGWSSLEFGTNHENIPVVILRRDS